MSEALETPAPGSAGESPEERPTVRVSGLAIVEGRVLLVRQQRDQATYWLLPGGGVRFAESFAVAIAREFTEETGVSIRPGAVIALGESISPDPIPYAKHVIHVVMDVVIDDVGAVAEPGDSAILECAWLPPRALRALDLRPPIAEFICAHIDRPAADVTYLGVLW